MQLQHVTVLVLEVQEYKMQKSVYLASPFFSSDQIGRVNKALGLLLKNPTIDSDGIFLPMLHQNEEFEFGSQTWQDATFRSDVRQINAADVVVAILDFKAEERNFEPDAGTMWEIGYAFAQNKPVIMLQFFDEAPLNLMLARSYTAFLQGDEEIDSLKSYDFNGLKQTYTDKDVF